MSPFLALLVSGLVEVIRCLMFAWVIAIWTPSFEISFKEWFGLGMCLRLLFEGRSCTEYYKDLMQN